MDARQTIDFYAADHSIFNMVYLREKIQGLMII